MGPLSLLITSTWKSFLGNKRAPSTRWLILAFTSIVFIAAAWLSGHGVCEALVECLGPTTVEMMPLPEGCVQTNEAPAAQTMKIVEMQKNFYHLALQKVIVCRTPHRFPASEPDFSETAFSQAVRRSGCRYMSGVAVSGSSLDSEPMDLSATQLEVKCGADFSLRRASARQFRMSDRCPA